MWQRTPRANIGLACGPSALVVIDLDTTAGPRPDRVLRDQREEVTPSWVRDAPTVLTWLRQRHGGYPERSGTLVVTTPSGGRHLYYRAPAPSSGVNVTSGAGLTSALGWGIDVRAAGGYVIAPPSVRPDGAYTCRGGRLQPVPAWLMRALDSAARITRPSLPTPRPGSPLPVAGAGSHYLAAALASEVERVLAAPPGTLNDTVTRAAFALGQLVSGAGLDQGGAATALLEAARQAGAAHAARGGKAFAEHKTAASIARALAAGLAHPRGPG